MLLMYVINYKLKGVVSNVNIIPENINCHIVIENIKLSPISRREVAAHLPPPTAPRGVSGAIIIDIYRLLIKVKI